MAEEKKRQSKPEILLHSCCGPCSTAVLERLSEQYRITLFFYNPNITEEEEYRKRKNTQLDFLKSYNDDKDQEEQVAFLEGRWDPGSFFAAVRGLEEEPEGGARCEVCFQMRLRETAAQAAERGISQFSTTLSVSPHKNHRLICQIGQQLQEETGVTFLPEDFKKKAGYQRSTELSRQYGLYRQNYCGCTFSKWFDKQ